MVSSNAPSVKDYLASLPPDRRRVIAAVRDLVHKNLPRGYEEGMLYGMISWYVPLSRFPNTYNGQPLTVVALAAQKNHASIYLMAVYGEPAFAAEFEAAWADAGKRLNMGKSCVRFKELDDLAVDVLADAIRRVTPEVFIARYEAVRGSARNQRKAAIEGSGAASTSSARASKTSASKTAASKKSASKTAASKTSASKKTASKATASKTAASKATASKTAASKATASKATASKSASSKKSASKKTASKATASKSMSKKSASKKAASKKAAIKKTASKTAASKNTTSKTASSKKTATKPSSKKTPARKLAAKSTGTPGRGR